MLNRFENAIRSLEASAKAARRAYEVDESRGSVDPESNLALVIYHLTSAVNMSETAMRDIQEVIKVRLPLPIDYDAPGAPASGDAAKRGRGRT